YGIDLVRKLADGWRLFNMVTQEVRATVVMGLGLIVDKIQEVLQTAAKGTAAFLTTITSFGKLNRAAFAGAGVDIENTIAKLNTFANAPRGNPLLEWSTKQMAEVEKKWSDFAIRMGTRGSLGEMIGNAMIGIANRIRV